MTDYYVDRRPMPDGSHRLHKDGCPEMPGPDDVIYLGGHPTCAAAVDKAGDYYVTLRLCACCVHIPPQTSGGTAHPGRRGQSPST